MDTRKKYLFASYTDFNGGKLTGAHRRFLELLTHVAETEEVIYVGRPAGKISSLENVITYPIDQNLGKWLPKHLQGAYTIFKALRRNKKSIICDYAISFGPVTSICYWTAGIRHIISLFREDLIGYQKALLASRKRLAYFQLQERLAVKVSEKIIVQCENDRDNLIARNEKRCENF